MKRLLWNPIAWLLVIVLGVGLFAYDRLMNGSTFEEHKSSFVERVQDISELATAEAFSKAVIERQDNQIFGQSIGVNLPGTKRQLLVVIPGSVKAGIELSTLREEDIEIDDETKRAVITLPRATFFDGVDLNFKQVDIFSTEGLFRSKAEIHEAYELAEEAKRLILEEAKAQGVLDTAERNAERIIEELFRFEGYDVTIQFKE